MATAYRTDFGTLRPPRETGNGSVIADAWASRVGVQVYRRADGSLVRELRPRDEVFAPASLAAFEGLVLTDDHPDVAVTPDNARGYAVGTVLGPGRADGTHVAVPTAWHDGGTIRKMRRGKRQLSVGYAVDLDPTPGTDPEFGPYDAVQRQIKPNHLALVDVGRAGTAAVKLDAVGPDGQRVDAAVAVETGRHSGARIYVESLVLSLRDLAAEVQQALGADASIDVSEVYRDDSDDPGSGVLEAPLPITAVRVCGPMPVCVAVTSQDLSPVDLHARVRAALGARTHLQVVDADGACMDRAEPLDNARSVPSTQVVTTEQLQAALAAANEKLGAANAERDAARADADAARRDRDTAVQARAQAEAERDNARKDAAAQVSAAEESRRAAEAAAEKARADAAAQLDQATAERVALLTTANMILGAVGADGKPIDRTKMSPRAIKAAIIKHVDGDDVAPDALDHYVDGMFDGACRRAAKSTTSLADTRADVLAARNNPQAILPTGNLEQQAAAAMRADNASAWRRGMTPAQESN